MLGEYKKDGVYETAESLGEFLFFGCWNKDGCADPAGPEAAVAAAIRDLPNPFLVIGGDNVYPDVVPRANGTGKDKIHPVERVTQGFRCISAPSRRILASLGNHNVSEKAVYDEHVRLHQHGNIFLPHNYYMLVFRGDEKAVIVLDTNIVEDEAKREEMLDWFVRSLEHLAALGIHMYYLVQHEPFVSYKTSNGKVKNFILDNGNEVLDILTEWPPAMILVADTHNYQLGIITYKVQPMIKVVSGTGGADLDGLGDTKAPIREFPGTYKVLDSAVAYGYQVVRDYMPTFFAVSPRGV
jgi:hypothetical protein